MKVLAKHVQCPVCGSESRVIENRVADEIASGKLPENFKTGAMISHITLFSPQHETILASKEVPVLMGLYDVCSECGTLYLVEMLEHVMIATPTINPPMKKDDENGGGNPWNRI